MKSSTRSVRFSCVCHFCLRFPDIRSRLEKNSKPKNFICIVRIQFFTFLTKIFRRKPIFFRSKSRNKHETDYSSQVKHFSSQCFSRNVEYCCDKAVEIVSPISKRILINDQKNFCNFSIKTKAFFTKLFIWTPIFDNPGNILFSKSKYFLPEFQTELKHSMFHLKEKFPKWSFGQVKCIFENLAGKFPLN